MTGRWNLAFMLHILQLTCNGYKKKTFAFDEEAIKIQNLLKNESYSGILNSGNPGNCSTL